MARFFGKVGFARPFQSAYQVWEDITEEREYIGDILQNTRRWQTSERLNDNLEVQNRISILGDDFINENLSAIKYVEWMGSKWKVTNIEISYPRLILSLGGVYNG